MPLGRLAAARLAAVTMIWWLAAAVLPGPALHLPAVRAAEPEKVIPPTIDELPLLWTRLGVRNAADAYAVIQRMASGDETVSYLGGQLRPAAIVAADRIRQLVLDLDHPTFDVREQAARELERLGSAATRELQTAQAQPGSLEVYCRLQRLIERATSAVIWSPEELQAVRAIGVLERIGSDEARAVLAALARGAPPARQTRAAAAALERIAKRRAAAEKLAGAKTAAKGSDGSPAISATAARTFGTPETVYQAAFSADGKLLATASGSQKQGHVIVFNAASGDQVRLRTNLPSAATGLAFSPDARFLAAGGGEVPSNTKGWLMVWDLESGEPALPPLGEFQTVYAVAFSPDGAYLAAGFHDKLVRIWELATGQQVLQPLQHGETVFHLAFSPGGRQLASAGGATYGASTKGKVCLWSLGDGKKLKELDGHTRPIFSVAFSPCGRRLASGSGDKTVVVWDCESGKSLHTLRGHQFEVYSVAFSPNASCLASADPNSTLRIWHAESGKQVCLVQNQPGMYRLAFSPDGKTLVRTGKNAQIWRLEQQTPGKPQGK
jgi:hypothetical protein